MDERIQKILARAGFGSRRSCEELIIAHRVRVNGEAVELGSKADATKDEIRVDGRVIKLETPVYIAMNKPRGMLSETDPADIRPNVAALVPDGKNLFPVGRLDKDSEGLILLTNDGELANHLTHPRYEHEKEYRVLLAVRPDEKQLEAWRHGVVMEDGHRTLPAKVEVESTFGKGTWIRVTMREGKKRQIREVGKILGMPVARLIRVRISSLLLGNLKPREWRYLTPEEVEALQANAPAPKPTTVRRTRPNGVRPTERGTRPKVQKSAPASRRNAPPSQDRKTTQRGAARPRSAPKKNKS